MYFLKCFKLYEINYYNTVNYLFFNTIFLSLFLIFKSFVIFKLFFIIKKNRAYMHLIINHRS